jgi:hypothetical protein
MDEEPHTGDAARALAEIRRRQQQVIDQATVPGWYWWAVGALMVVLAVGVDVRTPAAVGAAVPVFVVGLLSATGVAVRGQFRQARLRNGLLDGRGVAAILGFVALIVGGTLGIAFALRAGGVHYPATLACLAGGIVMGLGGPALMRTLRRIMLGNRAGSPR